MVPTNQLWPKYAHALADLGILKTEESNATMNVMSIPREFFVDFIDTTRHVVVGFVKEITSFLLEFKELVSGSSGFFSSFVRFFLSFSQAGLDVFKPKCQLLFLVTRGRGHTFQQPWYLG